MKTNEEKTLTPYTFAGYYEGVDKAQHEAQNYLETASELHNAIISGGDTIEERRRKVRKTQEALKMYAYSLARAQKDEGYEL